MAFLLDRRAVQILGQVGSLPDDLLLTTEQVATLSGTSKSFWEKLRMDRTGPRFVRLGTAIRYRAGDYKSWLAGRVQRATNKYEGTTLVLVEQENSAP